MARLSRTRWWLWPAVLALAFALLQGVSGARPAFGGDSMLYAQLSLRLYGTPDAQARLESARAACRDLARQAVRDAAVDPIKLQKASPGPALLRGCAALRPPVPDARQLRYEAIFNGRVGYPLLAGPPIKVFGIATGLWLTSVAATAAGGFLVALLLMEAGLGGTAALAGELIFLLCPLGRWGVQPLPEGTLNAAVLVALLGAWWLLGRRLLLGGTVTLLGLAAAGAVKYSSGALLAGCLTVAGLGCALAVRTHRQLGAWLLVAGGAALAVTGTVAAGLLGLPGLPETLQDTFTRHFHHQSGEVAGVWGLLGRLEAACWRQWLRLRLADPILPLAAGLGLWLLLRRRPGLGWLALAAAGAGLATIAAHPLVYEADRLGALLWLPAVLGLPLLLDGYRLDRRTARLVAGPVLDRAPRGAPAEPPGDLDPAVAGAADPR